MNNYKNIEVKIDWVENFTNSIVSQIFGNPELKENYVRIFAVAMLKIQERLEHEKIWGCPLKAQGIEDDTK